MGSFGWELCEGGETMFWSAVKVHRWLAFWRVHSPCASLEQVLSLLRDSWNMRALLRKLDSPGCQDQSRRALVEVSPPLLFSFFDCFLRHKTQGIPLNGRVSRFCPLILRHRLIKLKLTFLRSLAAPSFFLPNGIVLRLRAAAATLCGSSTCSHAFFPKPPTPFKPVVSSVSIWVISTDCRTKTRRQF